MRLASVTRIKGTSYILDYSYGVVRTRHMVRSALRSRSTSVAQYIHKRHCTKAANLFKRCKLMVHVYTMHSKWARAQQCQNNIRICVRMKAYVQMDYKHVTQSLPQAFSNDMHLK